MYLEVRATRMPDRNCTLCFKKINLLLHCPKTSSHSWSTQQALPLKNILHIYKL